MEKIMTWQSFKKEYQPIIYSTHDSTFGTKQIVQPTMKQNGFTEEIIHDVPENEKPLKIVKENYNINDYEIIVYYTWKYRDFHGKAISVYYKLKTQ